MAQHDYEITYEKGKKVRKQRVTRKDGQLDCPGCGGEFKLQCNCGTNSIATKVVQEPYKARC